MPDLVEQMYCSQQIFIPPNLPSILKKYAKAAIRTQPGDLLIWSSAYFRALAAGIPPPTKERIEYPPVGTPSGLSPGFLKVLINQIGKAETVSKDVLEERWRGVCLNVQALHDLLAVGMFGDEVHWLEFVAICSGTLQPSLTKTMMQLCELLTEEPEGGSAAIPVSTFLNLYKYLGKLDCGPVNTLEQYEETLKEDSETQCVAEVLEPHEEEVETGVPNIDWDTAIGNIITDSGDSGVEDSERAETVESVNAERKGETPSKDVDYTVTVDAVETGDHASNHEQGSEETDAGAGKSVEAETSVSEKPDPDSSQEKDTADADDAVADDQNDEQTREISSEPRADKTNTSNVGDIPAERTGSEELKTPSDLTYDPQQPDESQNEPQIEIAQASAEGSIIAEGGPYETDNPGSQDSGNTGPTDLDNNKEPTSTTGGDQSTVQSTEEPVVDSNDDKSGDADEGHCEMNVTDEPLGAANPDEPKADETSPEEPRTTETMINIGSVYIIDDDGTLSAAPRPSSASANDEGDLQERDSDKTIATNPSDVGMMVWPEIKPEKEEVEVEPLIEKEVTSDAGIEVLTDVDIQPTQEDIKMLPEKSEEMQPEAAGNEENIFAPQIDSFTELLEAESAPAEELSPEELAAAEGPLEGLNEESRQLEPAQSLHASEAPTPNVTQSTERTQVEAAEEHSKTKSERKFKKEAGIESLVKKDSEMMLLPTPVTSDIMLYVDHECEKTTQKVSPSQQLSDKMSLVDVQVGVPVDETVVEVVERHRYPKWMNIPGIGPIVPDHILEDAEKYFLKVSELQEGMVMPRNIKHFHCPPLELVPECAEDEKKWSIKSSIH